MLCEEGEVNGVSPVYSFAQSDGDARADTLRVTHTSGSAIGDGARCSGGEVQIPEPELRKGRSRETKNGGVRPMWRGRPTFWLGARVVVGGRVGSGRICFFFCPSSLCRIPQKSAYYAPRLCPIMPKKSLENAPKSPHSAHPNCSCTYAHSAAKCSQIAPKCSQIAQECLNFPRKCPKFPAYAGSIF